MTGFLSTGASSSDDRGVWNEIDDDVVIIGRKKTFVCLITIVSVFRDPSDSDLSSEIRKKPSSIFGPGSLTHLKAPTPVRPRPVSINKGGNIIEVVVLL